MSIADKLLYLNETKLQLREAINAAGGNLTQETPFREYAGGWLRDQSASLILDFSKQQHVAKDKVSMFPDRVGFEDIVTFTRSTGGGRFNAQGQYEWVGPDEPRIDYDPVTGECLGLLVEEQRTNLIPYSDTSGSGWAGGGNVERNVSTGLPSPFSVAATLEHSPTIGSYSYYQQLTPTAGTTYTFSVFVAYEDGRDVAAEFGAPGTDNSPLNPFSFVVNGTAYTWASISKTPVGRGGYRLSVTITPPDNTVRGWGIFIRTAHKPVASKLLVTGYMIEAGAFPTSFIPTEGAQVTRAADIATVEDIAPWYSPNQGSFSIKAKGHIGEPLLTAGGAFIIADSDELKEYPVSYSEDPQATQVDIGKGLIESIRYWPRETA